MAKLLRPSPFIKLSNVDVPTLLYSHRLLTVRNSALLSYIYLLTFNKYVISRLTLGDTTVCISCKH